MRQVGQLAAQAMAERMDRDGILFLLGWHPIGPYCTWPRPSFISRILKALGRHKE